MNGAAEEAAAAAALATTRVYVVKSMGNLRPLSNCP